MRLDPFVETCWLDFSFTWRSQNFQEVPASNSSAGKSAVASVLLAEWLWRLYTSTLPPFSQGFPILAVTKEPTVSIILITVAHSFCTDDLWSVFCEGLTRKVPNRKSLFQSPPIRNLAFSRYNLPFCEWRCAVVLVWLLENSCIVLKRWMCSHIQLGVEIYKYPGAEPEVVLSKSCFVI